MPARRTSEGQRKTMGRVMHEYAHGELKSGRSGKGGKVNKSGEGLSYAMVADNEGNPIELLLRK